jgi:hypothetical protein
VQQQPPDYSPDQRRPPAHLRVRHQHVKGREAQAQHHHRQEAEHQAAQKRHRGHKRFRRQQMRPAGQTNGHNDQQRPEGNHSPIQQDPRHPGPPAGHPPNVVEGVLDAREHRDRGKNKHDAAGYSQRAAARIANELVNAVGDRPPRPHRPLILGQTLQPGLIPILVHHRELLVGEQFRLEQRRVDSRYRRTEIVGRGRFDVRRNHAGDELNNEAIDLILPFLFQERAGDADHHRQHRDQRQQAGVSQRRSPDRATIARKTSPGQHPEVRKLLQLGKLGLRA